MSEKNKKNIRLTNRPGELTGYLAIIMMILFCLPAKAETGGLLYYVKNTDELRALEDFSGDCNSYTRIMRRLYERSLDLDCQFRQKILTGRADINRRICRQKSNRGRRQEIQKAEKRVNACERRGGGPYNKHCHIFAKTAVKHFEQNLDNYCGLSGSKWSGRYRYHYRRCLDMLHNNPSRLIAEQDSRVRQLNDCGAGNVEKRQRCQDYANSAVEQFIEARDAGCQPTGKIWNADRNLHYDFCMKATDRELGSMIRKRRREIAMCDDY